MLPGKTFLPEDILEILRRRYWFILVPFALVSAATALYTRTLPDMYLSEALISIVPPKLPANVVPIGSSMDLEDRIPQIRNEILSRTRLERVIQDLDLYAVERRTGIMQDIVERMRNEIKVTPVAGSAIRVGFMGRDARTVQRVADQLSAFFIDQSTRDRKLLLEGADQFLEGAVKEAETKLLETEKAVQEYKRNHRGELPEDFQANVQGLQNAQLQIQTLAVQAEKAADRRLQLERTIAELESQADVAAAAPMGDQPGTTRQQLTTARAALVRMQQTLKADHPDVQRQMKMIRDLEALQAKEVAEAPVSGAAAASPAEQLRQRKLQEARDSLTDLDRQAAKDAEVLKGLQARAADYLRRADMASARQSEMVALNRDYGTQTASYNHLRTQKEQTDVAASLERREIGEQFKMVDAAALPAAPFSPKRDRMNLMGMAAGLVIGLVLVGLLEYRDSTFKTDDELTRVLGLPVLAVVPLMLSDTERRRAWRRKLAVGTVLGSLVLGCLAIVTYTFVS